MMISPSTARAFAEIAARQADLREAFTPGAMPARTDIAAGPATQHTADPLSVAAPAGAFFLSLGETGRSTYSRDGAFHVENDVLVDRHGRPALGLPAGGGALRELHIDPVDSALGRSAGLDISADGSVAYTRTGVDPKSGATLQERVVIGRLALARFPAATRLQPLDATRWLAPERITPHTGYPGDGNFGALRTHAQESSGIDVDRGIERLQDAYLAFDALRAAQHAQGSVEKAAMDLLK